MLKALDIDADHRFRAAQAQLEHAEQTPGPATKGRSVAPGRSVPDTDLRFSGYVDEIFDRHRAVAQSQRELENARKALFEGRAKRYAQVLAGNLKLQLFDHAKRELQSILWALNNTNCAVPDGLEEEIMNMKRSFAAAGDMGQELCDLADECSAKVSAARQEETPTEYWWSCEGCKSGFKTLLSAYR